MIAADEMMNLILRTVPAFHASWQAHLDYWEGDAAGLCNDMQVFGEYVIKALQESSPLDLSMVFNLIERLLVEGDTAVKDAAATCFLENLLNSAAAGQIDVHLFAPYVGKESRKYCEAWENFNDL